MFVHRWDDHLYRRSERINKKKLQELVSDDSQVVGYKVNIQKSIPFLYTSNEQVKFEVKNSMSFT